MIVAAHFLPVLGRIVLPVVRRLAGFDLVILVPAVELLWRRHNRRIDDLAAARDITLYLQALAEAFEQLVDEIRLYEGLASFVWPVVTSGDTCYVDEKTKRAARQSAVCWAAKAKSKTGRRLSS